MTITDDRYCTIEESIIESCKEINLIMSGEKPSHSLDELWQLIDDWRND